MAGPGTCATGVMNLRILLSDSSFTSSVLDPGLETFHKISTRVYLLCYCTNLPFINGSHQFMLASLIKEFVQCSGLSDVLCGLRDARALNA
jgi:hypothetical protein